MANVIEIFVKTVNMTQKGFAEAEKQGAKSGANAGAAFGKALKAGLVIGGAMLFNTAIQDGVKLQKSTMLLTAAEKAKGMATAANQAILRRAIDTGEQYGQTQDKVQNAIRKFIGMGATFQGATDAATAAMKISAVTGEDYTSVVQKMGMSNATAARFMKQLGIAQIAGKDSATALTAAHAFLADRIKSAGGMAEYAKSRHLSLGEAQRLVTDASHGNISAFNKLGIEVIPRTNTAAQNLAQSTAILSGKFGTSGKIAAESFAGQVARLKAEFADAAAKLGERLVPVLTKFFSFIANHIDSVIRLATAIGGLMVVVKVVEGVKRLTVALGIFDTVAAANPVGLIVVAVAALAAAFVLAWKKSSGFRDAMKNIGIAALDVGIVIVKVAKGIVDTWMSMVGGIIHGAALAFGWVPGLGEKLRGADKAFQGFRKNVDGVFDGVIGKMDEYKQKLSDSTNQTEKAASKMSDQFNRQGDAAGRAKKDLISYSDEIRKNGVWTQDNEKHRQQLITDLIKAGVNGTKAREDVDRYTAAVQNNGKNSDAARGARTRLNNDIETAFKNSQQGKRDVDRLATAIREHGTKSDAARGARNRLTQDLINSGVDAHTARDWVNRMQDAINKMHGRNVPVGVTATASGTISIVGAGWAAGSGNVRFHAAKGAFINAGRSKADDVLARVSRNELIVPEEMVMSGEVDHLRGRIPGFKSGGFPSANSQISAMPGSASKIEAGLAGKAVRAAINKAMSEVKKLLSGSGSGVLAYAESFKGRVPYVWGGATPSGWDCSGFVSYVLKHFGLLGARTDAQGLKSWAKPAGASPGNLAFYGNPAHHVGFVVNGSTLLSALGTRYGTIESGLNMGDNSGYGMPPQGWGNGAGGAFTSGARIQELAYSMLQARGWGGQWPAFNSLENREAGWNIYARNPSSGAYGLAQFINGPGEYYQYGGNPNSASGQLTAMMNYIRQRYENPNNAWAHEIAYNWYGKGTRSSQSGLAMVGEYGRELVKLPQGSRVFPNKQTERIMAGGHEDGKLVLEVRPGGSSDFEQFMVMMIRKWVVIKGGGDVQKAYGRR